MTTMALFLGACSSVKLLYTFADDLVESQAEDHLLLDDDGEVHLRRQINALFDWHRARAMPGYARYFRTQAKIVEQGAINRVTVAAAVKGLRRHLNELTVGAAPFIAAVLVEHRAPDNVAYLRKRMAEKLQDRLDKLKQPLDKRIEQRVERIVENFERFTGDLKAPQRRIIRRYASASVTDVKTRILNRGLRQRAFIDFMSRQPSETAIAVFVRQILLRPDEIVDPDYKAFSESRWSRFETLLFDVFSSLSPAQRIIFADALREYSHDINDLSG